MERRKRNAIQRLHIGLYFWRTYDQQEIDLVEECNGTLNGYECKWSPTARHKPPREWLEAYPGAGCHLVTSGNWRDYLEG